MSRLRSSSTPITLGQTLLVGTLVLGGLGSRAHALSQPPNSDSPVEEASIAEPRAPAAEPGVSATPAPELAEVSCDPACPAGSECHDGRCFVACDPARGECNAPQPQPTASSASASQSAAETDASDEPPPQPETQPDTSTTQPLSVEADVREPEPRVPHGLGLRIAPTLGMCAGIGCRRIQVGSAAGSMGLGGGLDLRLTYRATPHLSLEVGGLTTIHGNDIDSAPLTMWMAALAGPRLHLSGGRWRVEPVLDFGVGYVRSLVRWSNAGMAADGLALSANAGIEVALGRRISLGALTGALVPYWARVCDADAGATDCYTRSELTSNDLRRSMWNTSIAILIHFS